MTTEGRTNMPSIHLSGPHNCNSGWTPFPSPMSGFRKRQACNRLGGIDHRSEWPSLQSPLGFINNDLPAPLFLLQCRDLFLGEFPLFIFTIIDLESFSDLIIGIILLRLHPYQDVKMVADNAKAEHLGEIDFGQLSVPVSPILC